MVLVVLGEVRRGPSVHSGREGKWSREGTAAWRSQDGRRLHRRIKQQSQGDKGQPE